MSRFFSIPERMLSAPPRRILAHLVRPFIHVAAVVDSIFGYHPTRLYFRLLQLPGEIRRLWYRIATGVPAGEVFLWISPRDIVYADLDSDGNWGIHNHCVPRNIGRVVGGDWDLIRSPVEEWRIYKALKELLIEGGDLRETDYFNDGSGRNHYISDGIWFCISEKNYEKETMRNQNIFRALRRDGYRTQKEMGSPDVFNEICVKIGREGEFLFENSIHRMVISKLLDLEAVYVIVTIRHTEWDELRRNLYLEAARIGTVGGESPEKYPHPDLRNIPFTRAGSVLLEEHFSRFRPDLLVDQEQFHGVNTP